MKNFHDKSYKALFSHPRLVEDLITTFVSGDIAKNINFSTLKKLEKHFVSPEYIERESDIIYEVKFKRETVYFYILIEFQSEPDKFMALRMLSYVLLFYQDLIKQKKLRVLPPIFPIMLYNGDEKWNAPDKLSDLIDARHKSLKPYIPEFKYYKILENEFSAKNLRELDSLSAALFQMENATGLNINKAVSKFISILEKELDSELKRDFIIWLKEKFRRMKLNIKANTIDELKEALPMFETRIMKAFEKAKLEGKNEGKLEGKLEAARNLLDILDVKTIAEKIGLTIEEVKKLKPPKKAA
jgi:predicted transposase/invertase (TIGR01784 family)